MEYKRVSAEEGKVEEGRIAKCRNAVVGIKGKYLFEPLKWALVVHVGV